MHKDFFLICSDVDFLAQLLAVLENQGLKERLAVLRDEAELQYFLSRSGKMPCGVRMNMPKVILWNISRWTREEVALVEQIARAHADGAAFRTIIFMSPSDSLNAEKYLRGEIALVKKPVHTIHLQRIANTIATWLDGAHKYISYN